MNKDDLPCIHLVDQSYVVLPLTESLSLTQVMRSTSLSSAASSLELAGYYNLSQKRLKLNQRFEKWIFKKVKMQQPPCLDLVITDLFGGGAEAQAAL